MKNTPPVLIGKRATASLLAVLMLLSTLVAGLVSGVPTAQAADVEVSEEVHVIPLEKITFPLQLGDFKQDEQLQPTKIEMDQGTGKPVITWTYTANVANAMIVPTQIERFFTTSAESGLGEPTITAITKNDAALQKNVTSSNNADLLASAKDTRTGDSVKAGTYTYTITTPVLEPRKYYVLNVANKVSGDFPAGTRMLIDGRPEVLKEDTATSGMSYLNYVLDVEHDAVLYEYVKTSPQIGGAAAGGVNVAGSYTAHDQIRWEYSFTNSTNEPQDHNIVLNFDESQTQQGPAKLYFYEPSESGYKLVEHLTQDVAVSAVPVIALKPGWRVQLVADAAVNDELAAHSFAGASLAPLKTNITINKVWDKDVADNEKLDSHFTISAQINGQAKSWDVTIPAGESTASIGGMDAYDADYKKIRYEAVEAPIEGMKLYNELVDSDTHTFTFYNRKYSPVDDTPIPSTEGCELYGVTSLTTSDIDQYWLKTQRYTWGSALSGTFRVPANATGGDRFILKLPDELILERAVDSTWELGPLYGNVNGVSKDIGRMYYTAKGEVTFVLWDNATHSQPYDGTFTIGRELAADRIQSINGKTNFPKNKTYYWGLKMNFDRAYDQNDPQARIVNKQLDFETQYIGLNGSAEPCSHTIKKDIAFHYEDDGIYFELKDVNKYVIGETDDSLQYRVTFNADQYNWNVPHFYDELSDTISLYNGNASTSLMKDVKVYEASVASRSGAAVTESMVELWPNRDPRATPGLEVTDVTLKDYNGTMPNANPGSVPQAVTLNKEIDVAMSGHTNQTIVLDIHARKIHPHPDGYYHNQAILGRYNRPAQRTIVQNSYQPTMGEGTANFGVLYDIHLLKTDAAGNPIKNNPGTFRLYRNDGVYTTKVQSDENGIITFKDVLPEGVTASGGHYIDGIYTLIETIPPQGYEKARAMRIKITAEDVNGQKVPFVELLGYTTVSTDGNQLIEDFEEVTGELKGKKFPGTLPLSADDAGSLFSIVDKKIPSLAIRKIDAISGAALPGAVVRVNEYALADYKPGQENEAKRTFLLGCQDPSAAVENCVKAKADEFRVHDAKDGHLYAFEEVIAPDGYDRRTQKFFVKVLLDEATGEYSYLQVQEDNLDGGAALERVGDSFVYKLENSRSNRIDFTKTDASGTAITDPEASFALYLGGAADADKEITLAGGQKVNAKKVPDSERSIASSASFEYKDLADGTYYLVEEKAPKGYILPEYPVAVFSVAGGVVNSEAVNNKIQLPNYLLGKFKLIKTDDSAQPQRLASVGFTLYSDEELKNPVGDEVFTDDSGVLYFKNLQPGTYWLKETTVPQGFSAGEALKVVVTREGKTLAEQDQLPVGEDTHVSIVSDDAAESEPSAEAGGSADTAGDAAANILDVQQDFGALYRQDPSYPNGSAEAEGIRVQQTISAADTLGEYKVDVSLSGDGLKNSAPATDVLVMLERRSKGTYMYGDGAFYADQIINNVIVPLRDTLPAGSRISIWKWATNSSNGEILNFTPLENAEAALRNAASKLNATDGWSTRHFGYDRDQSKGFPGIVDQGMADASANARKVVLNIAGLGLNESGTNDFNTNEALNFKNNSAAIAEMIQKYEFYNFSEAGTKSASAINYTPLAEEFAMLGADPSNMVQVADNLETVQINVTDGSYAAKLSGLVQNIGSGIGELRILLSDNVLLDEAATLNAAGAIDFASSGTAAAPPGKPAASLTYDSTHKEIIGADMRFAREAQSPSLSFSYYVRSDAASASLNEFQPINAGFTYKPSALSASLLDLPIPEVKVPGAVYKLARSWANGVPANLRASSSLVSLIGHDGNLIESLILGSETDKTFKAVPVFDSTGAVLEYHVLESGLDQVLSSVIQYNGDASYTGVKNGNATITVATDARKINFLVRKLWENTPEAQRSDVTVALQASVAGAPITLAELGVTTGQTTLSAANNFEAVFSGLPYLAPNGERVAYSVSETSIGGAAVNPDDYRTDYDFGANYATVTNIKTNEITVVNHRGESLKILKRSVSLADAASEGGAPSAGAVPLNAKFKLEKLDAAGNVDPSFSAAEGWTFEGDVDGMTVADIVAGKYRLTELEAPEGYQQLEEPIEFELAGALAGPIHVSDYATLSYDADTRTFELTVLNDLDVEIPGNFPFTGGEGIALFLVLGSFAVVGALLWLRRTQRSVR